MTDVEQLMAEMEIGTDEARRGLALELLKARRVGEALRRHHSRLPHQVQTALRVEVREQDHGAPMPGMPSLFANGSNA